jgi:hypothetical protein
MGVGRERLSRQATARCREIDSSGALCVLDVGRNDDREGEAKASQRGGGGVDRAGERGASGGGWLQGISLLKI